MRPRSTSTNKSRKHLPCVVCTISFSYYYFSYSSFLLPTSILPFSFFPLKLLFLSSHFIGGTQLSYPSRIYYCTIKQSPFLPSTMSIHETKLGWLILRVTASWRRIYSACYASPCSCNRWSTERLTSLKTYSWLGLRRRCTSSVYEKRPRPRKASAV